MHAQGHTVEIQFVVSFLFSGKPKLKKMRTCISNSRSFVNTYTEFNFFSNYNNSVECHP